MKTFKKFNNKFPIKILKAEDEFLTLSKYGKVLDFTSGWTSFASLGHNNADILNSIKLQMKKFCHADYNEFINPKLEKLSKRIVNHCTYKNNKIWYSGNSGSEALEAAMKLSYSVHFSKGKKKKIKFLHRSQSFHGASLHPLSVSTIDIFDVFKNLKTKNIKINQNNIFTEYSSKTLMGLKKNETEKEHLDRNLKNLEETIKKNNPENICAMVGETQLGSLVGDVPPQKGYWKGVQKILRKYDIHLILDEIYCGMGRGGKLFNFEYDGIDPDFVCVGKNTTSGCIPFSFVLSKAKYQDIIINKIGRVNLGHTFQGHSLGVAACNELINIIEKKKLMKRVNRISSFITKTINEELENCEIFKNIRGRGFALAVEHNTKNNIEFSKDLKRKMLNDHKILMNIKFHRTSMTPCFNMKMENIENTLEVFIKNFKILSKKYAKN
jgi:adenosylmethionine-8-amino-7-oxononanoate aminotransferase